MKRRALPDKKFPGRPVVWRDAEYAALRAGTTDAFDDRVSDDIFDVDDERAEVDTIVRGTIHGTQRRTLWA